MYMSNRPPYPGTPRWVKVFVFIVIVVVLLLVAGMLLSGEHGPSRHTPSGDGSGQVPPSFSVTKDHAPPEGDCG